MCLFVHTTDTKRVDHWCIQQQPQSYEAAAKCSTCHSFMKWMRSNRTYLCGSRQRKVRQPSSCPQPSLSQSSCSSLAAMPQAQETMYGDEGQASAPSLQGWEAPPALSLRRQGFQGKPS